MLRLSSMRRNSLALATLALTAQVAVLLHVSLTRHVVCSHGELVDSAPGPATVAAPIPVTDTVAATPSNQPAVAGVDHEHCAIPAQLRTPALRPDLTQVLFVVASRLMAVGPEGRSGFGAVSLLQAPKQSPPV